MINANSYNLKMNQLDGRVLRSQKSQNLKLDAIIKLINNGKEGLQLKKWQKSLV
jgi:hypothetical protein